MADLTHPGMNDSRPAPQVAGEGRVGARGRAGSGSPSSRNAATTIDVILHVSRAWPTPVPASALAESLKVPRTTLYRILRTLQDKAVLVHIPGRGYGLSYAGIELGNHLGSNSLTRLAKPLLQDLQSETQETVNLAVPSSQGMAILLTSGSTESLRMVNKVGDINAYHASALGKAFLSALDEKDLGARVASMVFEPLTPKTITEPSKLLKELARSRRRGYAVDDEESVTGVRCVGAALGESTASWGAISVSAPSTRLKETAGVGRLVARTAATISELVGPGSTVGSGERLAGPRPMEILRDSP
jgi:IclR family transcriptional regulator, acetate operon repressor